MQPGNGQAKGPALSFVVPESDGGGAQCFLLMWPVKAASLLKVVLADLQPDHAQRRIPFTACVAFKCFLRESSVGNEAPQIEPHGSVH